MRMQLTNSFIRKPIAADAYEVTALLRPEDRIEAEHDGFSNALSAITYAMFNTDECWLWQSADGEHLGIFGRRDLSSAFGHTFTMSCIGVERYRTDLAKISIDWTLKCLAKYQAIGGLVWTSYQRSIDWIRWLGFNVETRRIIKTNGLDCYSYAMTINEMEIANTGVVNKEFFRRIKGGDDYETAFNGQPYSETFADGHTENSRKPASERLGRGEQWLQGECE